MDSVLTQLSEVNYINKKNSIKHNSSKNKRQIIVVEQKIKRLYFQKVIRITESKLLNF